jgi:putative oxidoreductase
MLQIEDSRLLQILQTQTLTMKKLLSTRYSENAFSFALFFLRIVAGGLMIPHGYSKLQKFGEMAPTFADPFGIGSTLSLALLVFAEFFCAVLIVLGLLTRLASIPLIIAMSVAVVYGHNSLVFTEGQTATLFLVAFVVILLVGPGRFSADRMINK